ncbi:MAG: DUF2079 domain-containing protein [Isosphaeraceae bacterium]
MSAPGSRRGRFLTAAALLALTAAASAFSYKEVVRRYRTFQTGWAWDLAYYNQWYWALTLGDRTITVCPYAAYATEGPSVFRTNYLAPVRFAVAPLYRLAPGPTTLLLVHSVVFWLVIPAAYTLARAESGGSRWIGLAAASLTPLTPLLWPLSVNDFREIQMSIPFMLWAVQGVRGRDARLTALGVGGMLACRQELSVAVASLAFLSSREPEDVGRTHRWRHLLIVTATAWFFLAFLGHLRWMFGPTTAAAYLNQFGGARPGLLESLTTAGEILALGLGAWLLFGIAAPREALLALPWLWGLSSGRWAMGLLALPDWHHVRYTSPFVGMALAACVVGFARVCLGLSQGRYGVWKVGAVWVVAAAVSGVGLEEVRRKMAEQYHSLGTEEVQELWKCIDRVAPDDGVLSAYDFTAPLSSRRFLYSYVLQPNRPFGYPDRLPDPIRWLFYRRADYVPNIFQTQGFREVYVGPHSVVLERPRRSP